MAVPKLRFREFYSDWNKLTLNSIVRPNIIEVNKPTEDYIRLGIRSHCKGTFHQLVKIEDILEADKMFTVPKDNLIVNITFAWEQAIAITDENDEGKLVSGRFPTFAFKNGHLPQFYKFILPNKRLKYDLGLASPGGAGRNKVLNKKEFLKIKVGTTDTKEQQKIADFLTTFDKRITAQQNIIADMEEIKKGLLQKIFSQEIRFKDDNGEDYPEWEKTKLGDVCTGFSSGQTPSRNHPEYYEGDIPWLSSGELNRSVVYNTKEHITKDGMNDANLAIIPAGTFIMAITGLEADRVCGNCCILGIDSTLNQSCMYLYPKKDVLTVEFLFYWYLFVGKKYGNQYCQGTKQQSYNAELVKILPITLPKKLQEQQKIASFLSTYDKKIEAEKKILADLQEMKKGLLQQMFV